MNVPEPYGVTISAEVFNKTDTGHYRRSYHEFIRLENYKFPTIELGDAIAAMLETLSVPRAALVLAEALQMICGNATYNEGDPDDRLFTAASDLIEHWQNYDKRTAP